MKRIISGYNVYRCPDGAAQTFLGFVASLREARHLAAQGGGLHASMYESAAAAGQVGGYSAPDTRGESSEPAAWFGRGNEYCAVAAQQED